MFDAQKGVSHQQKTCAHVECRSVGLRPQAAGAFPRALRRLAVEARVVPSGDLAVPQSGPRGPGGLGGVVPHLDGACAQGGEGGAALLSWPVEWEGFMVFFGPWRLPEVLVSSLPMVGVNHSANSWVLAKPGPQVDFPMGLKSAVVVQHFTSRF